MEKIDRNLGRPNDTFASMLANLLMLVKTFNSEALGRNRRISTEPNI